MSVSVNFPEISHQGSLDRLCGVYAVINSLVLLSRKLNPEPMFDYVIRRMGKHLVPVILMGMTNKELRKLVLRPCIRFCRKHDLNLQITRAKNEAHPWRRMLRHHECHGPGSIVLGLGGEYEHWSCVKQISPKTIILTDDSETGRVHRHDVERGIHVLESKHIFLMSFV